MQINHPDDRRFYLVILIAPRSEIRGPLLYVTPLYMSPILFSGDKGSKIKIIMFLMTTIRLQHYIQCAQMFAQ